MSFQQRRQQPPDFRRQKVLIQVAQRLAVGQPRFFEQPLRFAFAPVLGFAFAQVLEEAPVAPVLLFGPAGAFLPQCLMVGR